jgi:hypothetical protein
MKKFFLLYLVTAMCLLSLPASAQNKDQSKTDQSKADTTDKLGMAGDGLDLYAVLDLFQKSKTIEAFEKSLNDPKQKINNLDLNLDKKVDFIKVVTQADKDSSYRFVLQVDVSKTETQDVAVIYLTKQNGKVSIQMVGDEELYGKDYVIEPKGNSSITANPGYTGENPVTVNVPAQTVTVVQSAPVVQYVYSPAYVPYYPPYYYGYYPGWFAFTAVMTFGIYASHCWGYHGGYYGGHYGGGNTVVINNYNRNSVNHYNNTRNRSTTVSDNMNRGNYGNGNRQGNRGSSSTRPSAGTSDRASTRPSTGTSDRASTRPSAGTSDRSSTGASNRAGSGASASTRPSTSNMSSSRPSTSNLSSSSRSGSYGGGGRSMSSGGGYRGGGGGRRR